MAFDDISIGYCSQACTAETSAPRAWRVDVQDDVPVSKGVEESGVDILTLLGVSYLVVQLLLEHTSARVGRRVVDDIQQLFHDPVVDLTAQPRASLEKSAPVSDVAIAGYPSIAACLAPANVPE
eukprot:CAMPEP_0198732284 /NCGR_PEP_ID=MMETSP1475-20131203/34876_1 /TAXON_ID= ORGANISM="Unidentified sp., Strain CCMP1999" /NCGR_SAMPLE_ID=MMETSP1475 /ASSEMBLY_ACC=CAM_ASM_001111 /LENGTH=123 /DNA_ID=CAMNT_0044495355 /DNA_START=412 /DNA_END=784 /DNA_ORIENTATION=-